MRKLIQHLGGLFSEAVTSQGHFTSKVCPRVLGFESINKREPIKSIRSNCWKKDMILAIDAAKRMESELGDTGVATYQQQQKIQDAVIDTKVVYRL